MIYLWDEFDSRFNKLWIIVLWELYQRELALFLLLKNEKKKNCCSIAEVMYFLTDCGGICECGCCGGYVGGNWCGHGGACWL